MEHIDTWIFDLDNTLYPPSCNLFAQIDVKMGEFISRYLGVDARQARTIQKSYFRDYGTTLNGLMELHGMEPEPYLEYVHNIDHSALTPDPVLQQAIQDLPGRKMVYTNGSAVHAKNVLDKLGLSDLMEDIHDIRASRWQPKPHRTSYEAFLERTGVNPGTSAMFEDLATNLKIPDEMGMTTVLVRADGEHPDKGWAHLGTGEEPYVHHLTSDLGAFLSKIRTCR